MILDELDPAVLEQLTERERQELIAAAEGLQGSALQTHMAAAHPTMRAPRPAALPRLNLQPGQMFSYSTQGPGRFNPDTDIAVETPTGETVYAPGNAQNISMVQGPAGPTESEQQAARNEEAQRQAFTQMMSGIPLKNFKDAETATKMAIRFNADRQYQALVNKGVPVNEAVMRVAPMYAAAGIPMTGAAAMIKATQQPPNYQYIAPTNGAPGYFGAPGRTPVVVRPGVARTTAAISNTEAVIEAEQQADEAEQSGDMELADSLRAKANLMRSQMKGSDTAEREDIKLEMQIEDLLKPRSILDTANGGSPEYRARVATANRLRQRLSQLREQRTQALTPTPIAPPTKSTMPGTTLPSSKTYSSADAVKAAVKSGEISREEALRILKSDFGFK